MQMVRKIAVLKQMLLVNMCNEKWNFEILETQMNIIQTKIIFILISRNNVLFFY